MPIPDLNIQYPDVGKLAANYLQMRQIGMANRALNDQEGYRNWLETSGYQPGAPGSQNILQNAPPQYAEQTSALMTEESKRQAQEMQRNATAMKMIMDAKTPEMGKAMAEQFAPDIADKFDFRSLGDEVEFTNSDGMKIKGPRQLVASMLQSKAENPEIWLDPKQAQINYAWAAQNGLSITAPQNKPDTELGKLIAARDELAPNDPNRRLYEERIKKLAQVTGTIIRQTPDGGFEVIQGANVGNVSKLEKPVKKDIQTKIVNGRELIARIDQIAAEFKPEYQEVGTRFQAEWTGIKAKLGQDVPKEDAKKLTDFKKYQRKAIENINLYIKEMTGAQMSEKEADRLRLAQPDPGEHWYSGDDPLTFKAKMDDVRQQAKLAVARYNYYLNEGKTPAQIKAMQQNDVNQVPLEDVPQTINAKGAELEAQFASKGLTGAELEKAVDNELRRIFGI